MRVIFLMSSVLSCGLDYVLSRNLNEGTIGSTVVLDCHSVSKQVEWNVPYNGRIVYTGSYFNTEQSTHDLLNRIYKIGNTLRIVNVQKTDEGIYECIESNKVTESFNLSLPVLISSAVPAYYRSLNVDTTLNTLIVGSMNAFVNIDLSGDTPIQGNIISTTINPSQSNVNNCKLSHSVTPYCQNHIRILAKRSKDIWLACGTNGDSPTGYELNITDGSYIDTGYVPCSNNPFHNSSSVFTASNDSTENSYMYYGSVYYSEKTIQRPIYNTDGTIREYMKGVDSTNWMNEPEFVGSFELEETVLYFYREKAVEVDPNDPKIYSRVAKVCKKDVGGNTQLRNKWTSFQKARLICSIPETYPVHFDTIQDVVTHDKITFYGLFTSGSALTESVICAFSLSYIESAFAGQFKYQPDTTSYWTPVTSVPSPRPGECVDDSLTLTDENLEFIANKPLMHNSVDSVQGKPLFILENEALQQLELHEDMSELVFYTASNRGNVYKLFSKNGLTYILSNYSVSDVNYESNIIWTMKQLGDYLYIGTDNSVRVIQIINCEQYRWVDSCVKDPHCIWINDIEIINGDNQCFNRCRSMSFVPKNSRRVVTHENHDLSSSTTVNCLPSDPIYFRTTDTDKTSIDLEWSHGFHVNITSYIVKHRKTKEDDWKITEKDLNTFSISLTGLDSNEEYAISVCAKNNFGESIGLDIIYVSTEDACLTSSRKMEVTILIVTFFLIIVQQFACVAKLLRDRCVCSTRPWKFIAVMLVFYILTIVLQIVFVDKLVSDRSACFSSYETTVAIVLGVLNCTIIVIQFVCVFKIFKEKASLCFKQDKDEIVGVTNPPRERDTSDIGKKPKAPKNGRKKKKNIMHQENKVPDDPEYKHGYNNEVSGQTSPSFKQDIDEVVLLKRKSIDEGGVTNPPRERDTSDIGKKPKAPKNGRKKKKNIMRQENKVQDVPEYKHGYNHEVSGQNWPGLSSRALTEEIYHIEDSGEMKKDHMLIQANVKLKHDLSGQKKTFLSQATEQVTKL